MTAKAPEGRQEVVLIIEDDPTLRLGLTKTLRSAGFRVEVAKTGTEGLDAALALRPDLIIADEIVSGLDVSTQAHILLLLKQLRAQFGLTLVFISHDLSVIRVLCDDVAILQGGEIVEAGPVAEIFARSRHPYTRTLLAAIPLPDVEPGWLDDKPEIATPTLQGSAA